MTRFLEEHYATRAWKKAFAAGTLNTARSSESDPRTSRAQHFQKPLSVRKAIKKAQKAQLRMF